ncbi:MAG: PA2169 family four-helix-bundle protein [Acidobacteriaceae bacterium]|nr:PA2169 family four-helix-bundle protein [Acidobacteriaceae bacterium]
MSSARRSRTPVPNRQSLPVFWGRWTALKGALTGHSEHQILEETERGEDFSRSRYRNALAHELPTELRSVLERQYQQVQSAHNRIKALRDSSATHGNAVA